MFLLIMEIAKQVKLVKHALQIIKLSLVLIILDSAYNEYNM